jgi:predicted nucleic acid-binding protein
LGTGVDRSLGEAAAIFRLGHAKGVSLTTMDALIAAIALDHRASVFTVDKDFSRIARLTGLLPHPLPGA